MFRENVVTIRSRCVLSHRNCFSFWLMTHTQTFVATILVVCWHHPLLCFPPLPVPLPTGNPRAARLLAVDCKLGRPEQYQISTSWNNNAQISKLFHKMCPNYETGAWSIKLLTKRRECAGVWIRLVVLETHLRGSNRYVRLRCLKNHQNCTFSNFVRLVIRTQKIVNLGELNLPIKSTTIEFPSNNENPSKTQGRYGACDRKGENLRACFVQS